MSLSRRSLLAAALVPVLALSALPAAAQGITGSYRVEGRNPDGTAYGGTVRIADHDGVIAMAWTVGGSTYQGTGLRNGDVVRVDWGDAYPVVYVRMPGGELHGTWANGRALERLIP